MEHSDHECRASHEKPGALYSSDPSYMPNREYRAARDHAPSRDSSRGRSGGWQGDLGRTTTREQRERGFTTPDQKVDDKKSGRSRTTRKH